jgi:hypothetical protein
MLELKFNLESFTVHYKMRVQFELKKSWVTVKCSKEIIPYRNHYTLLQYKEQSAQIVDHEKKSFLK